MALIVENGTGVLGANSYVGRPFAFQYLNSRNRLTAWVEASQEAQEAALISATDYIDKRFGLKFLGQIQFTNLHSFASLLALLSGLPAEDQTLTVGTSVFTFKDVPSQPGEIEIGADAETLAVNIENAMAVHPDVAALAVGVLVTFQAREPGPFEATPISSTSEEIVFDGEGLQGGSLSEQQPLCFPRTAFIGIPSTLKMATVEYALRALEGPLMPDPVVEETGQAVRRRSEKVGPVEEEIVYQNSVGEIFKTYPEADRLIKPLITLNGGVYR